MKVTLENNYRSLYTIDDLDRAKRVIHCTKDDGQSANYWAEYAVNEALKGTSDYLDKILEATATTAKNSRAWNCYDDDSQRMDVWVEAIAKTWNGFIEIGAYLSDIWQSGAVSYKDHMYIAYYTRKN